MKCLAFSDLLGTYPVGTRVRFTLDVDRYPSFVVPEHTTGTVVYASRDGMLIHVDQFVEGLSDDDEWSGDFQWNPDDQEDGNPPPFEVISCPKCPT